MSRQTTERRRRAPQRLVGLAVFGYVTASIASFLADERVAQRTEEVRQSERIAERGIIRRMTQEIQGLRVEVERLRDSLSREGVDRGRGKPE
ncbi:MAG: hypothetical protein ACM3US_12585 [Sphingomonadaceae bacterium]